MIFSLFTNGGALNSRPVFDAFSIGLTNIGHTVVYNDLSADVYVIWSILFAGRMQSNKQVLAYAKEHDTPVVVLEVGGLKRNITWKIGINGINTLPHTIFQKNRSKKLGIVLSDWKKSGDHILICGQREASNQWTHGDVHGWLLSITRMIKQYTNRKIIFRPHPREPYVHDLTEHDIIVQHPIKIQNTYDDFDFTLDNAWLVISPSSSPGIHAIINGIPVHTDANSLAYHMSTPLNIIEQPLHPDREEWLEHVCHMEWTMEEMKDPSILSRILVDVQ